MSDATARLQHSRNIQDVVFGLYQSRRFGMSLGVNPLCSGARLCNFDCIYCECGTAPWSLNLELRPQLPGETEVRREPAQAAQRFRSDDLDAVTICGNGEPTLNRNLEAIVDAVVEARDYYWPQARTVILHGCSEWFHRFTNPRGVPCCPTAVIHQITP